MSYEIRLPNITSNTEAGQLEQMRSYLFQLVQQLNFALNTISDAEKGDTSKIVQEGAYKALDTEQTYTDFSTIKALIINSSDIVNAYYDVIKKRLDCVYVAESDFGDYSETTSKSIEENSKNITNIYNDIQTITSDIVETQNTINNTNSWTRTGLLDYESSGIPIYGFEVGQKTTKDGEEVFNKYARFTASGIYFYLPGVNDAVAWMSGTKLYITNAEITGSLKIGKYALDFSNGIAFMWVGGQ